MKKGWYAPPELEIEWIVDDIATLSSGTGNEDEEIGGGGNPWAE